MTLKVAARTDVGLVRPHNEDTYFLADISSAAAKPNHLREVSADGVLLGVCDGVGGAAAGEVASQLTSRTIADYMRKHARGLDDDACTAELTRSIEKANHVVAQAARRDPQHCKDMATTATVAHVRRSKVLIAQVGDSRAYLFRQGLLSRLTEDQSLAAHLAKMGVAPAESDESEAPGSNVLMQAVGTAKRLAIGRNTVELQRHDRFLLCSDGLWGMVPDDKIQGVLNSSLSVEECCETLITLANASGGHDNITVVLCEVGGAPPPESRDAAWVPGVAEHDDRSPTSVTPAPWVSRLSTRHWTLGIGAAALLLLLTVTLALPTSSSPRPAQTARVASKPTLFNTPSSRAEGPQQAADHSVLSPAVSLDGGGAEPSISAPKPTRPQPTKPRPTPALPPAHGNAPLEDKPAGSSQKSWQQPEGDVARNPFR